MTHKTTADVVVIGGGVIGSAVAYFLAKRQMRVILVEKKGIAAGTSGRCDGNVLVQDKLPGFDSSLARISQELFPVIAQEIDYDIEWSQKGSLLVIESEEELAAARLFYEKLKAEGLPVRMLDSHEVRSDEPLLADDVVGGLEVSCDGAVNPMALAFGLCLGAKRMRAEIRSATTVIGIRLDSSGKTCEVETDRGNILTAGVVNAAGIWAGEIGKMVGIDIPVMPRQGQILVSERARVARRKIVEFGYLMAKFGKSYYKRRISREMERFGIAFVFEPTGAGNFLIGSSRQFTGYDISCNLNLLREMAIRAVRFFPVLEKIRIIRSYAGLRPYTPDHFPIVSESSVPGFYVATGHEGDGIGLSLITGKLMSQIILKESTDISIEPLSLARFLLK